MTTLKTQISRKEALDFQKEHRSSTVHQIYAAALDLGVGKTLAYNIVRGTANIVQPLPDGKRKHYHGYYVYDDGRVYSPNMMKFLKPRLVGDLGHYGYALKVGDEKKELLAHRLVLILFVGPPPKPDSVCRHLDGNPTNNKVGNLAWGTNKDNSQDAIFHGTTTRGVKNSMSKLTEGDVLKIKRRWEKVSKLYDKPFPTEFCQEVGARFGVSHGTIDAILRGRSWNHIVI